MEQTYEMLRYDRKLIEKRLKEKTNSNDNINDANNDEITSTGSFLSNLSDVSGTQTENDLFESSQSSQVSKEFNEIFGLTYNDENGSTENISRKRLLERTFQVQSNTNDMSAQDVTDKFEIGNRQKMERPSKQSMKYPSDTKIESQFHRQNSGDTDSNPIYERIDDDSLLFGYDNANKENSEKVDSAVESRSGTLSPEIDQNEEMVVNPHSCQHTFSHRNASRSVVCFLCSKK